jgi:hypothetical protein
MRFFMAHHLSVLNCDPRGPDQNLREELELATLYSNLAYVEQELGNIEVARQLKRQAYCIFQAKLGPNPPDTQDSRRWLEENDPDYDPDNAL